LSEKEILEVVSGTEEMHTKMFIRCFLIRHAKF